MQTRPGNEPEPEESGDESPELDETVSLESLADEDSREAEDQGREAEAEEPAAADAEAEPEAEAEDAEEEAAPELGETVDLASLPDAVGKPEKRGPEPGETVDLASLLPEDAAKTADSGAGQESGEPADSEKHDDSESAETVDLGGLLPDEAAEKKRGPRDLAETVDLRSLLPEDSAEEGAEPEAAGADVERGKREPGPRAPGADKPEPPLRRRSPDAEGEPPRRRPLPGGQPPRRPGPGQDPRRGPAHPHGAHGSAEPGPKRRPPSDHAPDDAAKRHPGPEPRSTAIGAAAAAASGPTGPGSSAAGSGAAAAKSGAPATGSTPGAPKSNSVSLGRRRLFNALWPPRLSRNQAVVGVLLAALGAAVAIQVRATNTSDEILRGARADDLVNILDEVTSRGQSLDAELRTLETQNAAIQDSTDKAQAALTQAQQKAKDLQILAGTVKAKGSGITMTITDPKGQMKSATLLNALEELRAAGAEVIQVNDVRVVVSSSFVDTADGRIALDGHELTQPYVYKVIGDPNTLGPAMQIPGGVVANVKSTDGANATIASGQVLIDAVVAQPNPQYAKPN